MPKWIGRRIAEGLPLHFRKGSEQEFVGHPAFAGFLPFTSAGPLVIRLLQRCLTGSVCRLFARIFGWHRGRRQSPSRSGLPGAGWEKPRRKRDIMCMNWPPSHPELFGWSNAQLGSGSNTDNTSLNQQIAATIAPCFAPASCRIPSSQRRSDEDSLGREHHPKPRPHAPNAREGPKRSSPRQLDTSADFCAER